MIINPLILPYSKFKVGDVMEPDEFNSNNTAIVEKLNVVVDVVSEVLQERGDEIFIPEYITKTYIDPIEIKSPLITGNTLIGSTGMVGMSSVGTNKNSIRFWAGAVDREVAPFRVSQDGSVVMSKLNINLGDNGSAGITSDTPLANSVVIWAGSNDKDIAPFKVTKDGSVTMSNVTVGQNGIVGLTSIAPTDNSIVIWAGNANKNIAPFRVTKDGRVTLRDVDITFDSGGNYGISPNEPGENPIVLWAGNENKLLSPFRVTKNGSVVMTKSTIETSSDENNLYIKMEGSKITGGRKDRPAHYTIGTAEVNIPGSKSGILQILTFLDDKNTIKPNYVMQVTHNTIMTTGSNFVIGTGGKGMVVTKEVMTNSHTESLPGNAALSVNGNLNVTGDIYVNGVKMKLTPA